MFLVGCVGGGRGPVCYSPTGGLRTDSLLTGKVLAFMVERSDKGLHLHVTRCCLGRVADEQRLILIGLHWLHAGICAISARVNSTWGTPGPA